MQGWDGSDTRMHAVMYEYKWRWWWVSSLTHCEDNPPCGDRPEPHPWSAVVGWCGAVALCPTKRPVEE
jgi:hypothetical protein